MKSKADLFLGFGQALPFFHPKHSIIVVYDLAFEMHPNLYPGKGKKLSRQTRYAVRHASHIVAISQKTKRDLITLYEIPEEKITVMPLGVDQSFSPIPKKDIVRVLKKHVIEQPYFLFVGNFRPVKNADRILEAYKLFYEKQKRKHSFVIVGTHQDRLPRYDWLLPLGNVPQDEMPALYSGATALVSPSLYEGFGLAYLEAMACGCPVIGSTSGSIPEVVGDAGILVDPFDTNAISNAMQKIINENTFKEILIQKGFQRVNHFSWKISAQKLYKMTARNS